MKKWGLYFKYRAFFLKFYVPSHNKAKRWGFEKVVVEKDFKLLVFITKQSVLIVFGVILKVPEAEIEDRI